MKRYSNEDGYIASRTETSKACETHVYIRFSNPNDFEAGADKRPFNPSGQNLMAFYPPEDLIKNLPKAIANIGMAMGCVSYLILSFLNMH